jgi:4-hydroxybenzoate polyprenyltransferase
MSRSEAVLRALRPHQWAKNALIFVPLLLAYQLGDARRWLAAGVAFVAFCAVASAGYVLNDLVDVDADRAHPSKRRRPIASGALPLPAAFALLAALVAGAALTAGLAMRPAAAGMVLAYGVLTCAYSFWLKEQLLLDVLVLAGLYTHRVLSGGVAAEVEVSPWLLAFSTFFFLSLALVKRFSELRALWASGAEGTVAGRAYQVGDRTLVETVGIACGTIAVLVLCLFVSSDDVSRLYRSPGWLWAICPVMFYWIARVWLLAHRGELHEDPVLFATTDRNSYAVGLLVLAVGALATW